MKAVTLLSARVNEMSAEAVAAAVSPGALAEARRTDEQIGRASCRERV